jgi:hypothetical protein
MITIPLFHFFRISFNSSLVGLLFQPNSTLFLYFPLAEQALGEICFAKSPPSSFLPVSLSVTASRLALVLCHYSALVFFLLSILQTVISGKQGFPLRRFVE